MEQDYDIKNNKRSDEVAELVLWGKDQILEKMDDAGTDITPYSKSSFSELIIQDLVQEYYDPEELIKKFEDLCAKKETFNCFLTAGTTNSWKKSWCPDCEDAK